MGFWVSTGTGKVKKKRENEIKTELFEEN